MKTLRILLIVIAVVCIGVAVSYPIRYKVELDQTESELEELSMADLGRVMYDLKQAVEAKNRADE